MSRATRRAASIAGSVFFLLIAPGVVAGIVPWWITRWHMQPPFFGTVASRIGGGVLIAAGLPVLLDSFARFALGGLGTPAPVFPTKRLVVTGFYRSVRNPMYVGVVSIVLGQALLFAYLELFYYAAFLWLAFHLFVVAYEEPTLQSAYGPEYEEFCRHVRRWIPRMRPWHRAP